MTAVHILICFAFNRPLPTDSNDITVDQLMEIKEIIMQKIYSGQESGFNSLTKDVGKVGVDIVPLKAVLLQQSRMVNAQVMLCIVLLKAGLLQQSRMVSCCSIDTYPYLMDNPYPYHTSLVPIKEIKLVQLTVTAVEEAVGGC